MAATSPQDAASTSATRDERSESPALDRAALLAMDTDDYMNDAQRAFFRARLTEMRGGLGYTTSVVLPDPSDENPIENGDRAFIEEERAIATSLLEHNAAQLAEIDAALKRIDEGSYGFCMETGEEIGLPRLLAYPTALYTVEVQERHERQSRLGDARNGGTGVAAET